MVEHLIRFFKKKEGEALNQGVGGSIPPGLAFDYSEEIRGYFSFKKLQKSTFVMVEKITALECELIGAIIGDGHIHKKESKYYVGITGNIKTDREYFNTLSVLSKKVWNKTPQIRNRAGGIRLRFYSKAIVTRLIKKFGLPFNSGKCYRVKIPKMIASNWKYAKHAIRGIVDTDGSVFTANKPGSPNYPSIEITTASRLLAEQLKDILTKQEFRVAKIWNYTSKLSVLPAYKVPLNGRKNLEDWISKIGFSNPHKLRIALNALL